MLAGRRGRERRRAGRSEQQPGPTAGQEAEGMNRDVAATAITARPAV